MNINSVNDQIKNGGCSLKPVNVLSTFKDFFQFPKLNVNARLGMIFFSELTSVQIALVRLYTYICRYVSHPNTLKGNQMQGFITPLPPLPPVEYLYVY